MPCTSAQIANTTLLWSPGEPPNHADAEWLRVEPLTIEYVAIPELAGRRPKAASPSARPCWRNRGFRNYADHMRTGEFRDGIRKLLALRGRVAVMCAEAVPWRCHRSLIGDYLVLEKKRKVEELVGTRARPHRRTACARVVRGHLTYDLP